MSFWNPWRGCHKCSEGCKFCYIHQGDLKKGIDTNLIVKTKQFFAPIEKNKNGEYKMKGNQVVYLCFSSDFLLEDADQWRGECWKMIKERNDLTFLFLTKRIERFLAVAPTDWENGYDNVIIGVSVENQTNVDQKLSILSSLPIKHKNIILQPLIGPVKITKYLAAIELVVLGGEYGSEARPLNYDWVLDIKKQCVSANVDFTFRQCGTNFIKDGKSYKLKYFDLIKEAKKANIDFKQRT